jgi:SAM-dependent methyltransferase
MSAPWPPLGEIPPAGHPMRFTVIGHGGRRILGPVAPERIDRLVARSPLAAGDHVLEIGSGKGELLIRLLTRWGAATGEGFDRNPWFLAEAQAAGVAAGLADRLAFIETDVPGALIAERRAAMAIGVGATGILGDQAATVAGLAGAVRPGGTVLFGDGLWVREPSAPGMTDFGMTRGELPDGLEGFAALGATAGLEVLDVEVVEGAEWDRYEDDYTGAIEAWVASHPDDPDATAFAERAALFRRSYAAWRRDAMGFALARFRVPA